MAPLVLTFVFSLCIAILSVFFLKSKRAQLVISALLPIALLPYWISQNSDADIFVWIKSYSVFASLTLIVLSDKIKKHAHGLLSLFLGINILEAVIRNTHSGYMVNAITGALLLLPLIFGWWKKGTNTDLPIIQYGLSELWIIAYTIWNIVFILIEFPSGILPLLITLILPLAMGLINPKDWIHWRAITFALYFYVRLSMKSVIFKMDLNQDFSQYIPYLTFAGLLVAILMLTEQFIRPRFSPQPRVIRSQTS